MRVVFAVHHICVVVAAQAGFRVLYTYIPFLFLLCYLSVLLYMSPLFSFLTLCVMVYYMVRIRLLFLLLLFLLHSNSISVLHLRVHEFTTMFLNTSVANAMTTLPFSFFCLVC